MTKVNDMISTNDISYDKHTPRQSDAVQMFRTFLAKIPWSAVSVLIVDKKLNILIGVRAYDKGRWSIYCEFRKPNTHQSTLRNVIEDYSVLDGEFFFNENGEFDTTIHTEYAPYAERGYGWFGFSMAILNYHKEINLLIEKNNWIK